MLLQFLLFSCITISVYGAGEIAFLHSPPSVELIGQQPLPLSHLSDVFAAGLGFTEASDWRGLKVSDPFNFADAVVVVSVPGLSSFDVAQGHKFPLETDIALGDVWSSLETKVAERFPFSEKESAYYLSLDEGRVAAELNFGPLTFEPTHLSVLKNLNPDISHDREFIEQIALLNDIAKKVEEDGLVDNDIDEVPNLYWIVVPGLHPLVDRYGLKSKQVFEAKQQLQASLQRLNEAFEKVFENKVSIAAVASDAPHTRRFRRSTEDSDSDEERLNLAPVYSPDFPVMFNIFLWFGIAYTFTLLAVTLGIADMDPGRDSIIYRMTSNRMKKDN